MQRSYGFRVAALWDGQTFKTRIEKQTSAAVSDSRNPETPKAPHPRWPLKTQRRMK